MGLKSKTREIFTKMKTQGTSSLGGIYDIQFVHELYMNLYINDLLG